MYEDIYFSVRDISENDASSSDIDTDEQLYDNSQEEETSGEDSFQSCEEEQPQSLHIFASIFNQIIQKIKSKAKSEEVQQKTFFGYQVTELDLDVQYMDMNREELESEFYNVFQACETIPDGHIKDLTELALDNIIELNKFDGKQRQIFVNIMYYRWLDMQ